MNVQELRNHFISQRKYEPIDSNELLDFARQIYLHGNLPIRDYRNIVRQLETDGAKKPEYVVDEIV
ncbi:YppF family protein [Cytobacillus sp. IB215665]|uniref:YppF family protein n=1 Tax=Cytobacillus sp. IB215665 TaxID=3097357 RepID=UPI002A14F558|nr:YppF family protein [Cytobacillus sp. IB215665]MDX8366482.1 YppF family protein [Cytobacillus sp. IB215665]